MKEVTKRILNRFLAKKSGRRFAYAYLAVNTVINKNPVVRIGFFILGFFFALLGFIMLFTPGPGVLFLFIGGILLCVISRKIAHLFDRLEVHGLTVHKKYFGKNVKK